MAFGGATQLIRTVKEIDLGAIKEGAEARFALLITGEADLAQRLADALEAGRDSAIRHPWVTVAPAERDDLVARYLEETKGLGDQSLGLFATATADLSPALSRTRERLQRAGIPTIVVLVGEATREREAGLVRAGESARALLPALRGDALSEGLGPAILAVTPEGRGLRLALARQFPALRSAVVDDLIEDVARANAGYALSTGLAETVPGLNLAFGAADTLVLTKNQLLMAYKISLANGREGNSRELMMEVAGVIGGGLLFRQIARQLVGLLPIIGIAPKVAVSYGGTRFIGRLVKAWAAGEPLPDVGEMRGLMGETLAGLKALKGKRSS